MRIALVVLVAACSAEPAATHPVAPEPARAPVVANTAPAAAAIPGTTGTCEADPKVDGVDDNRRPVAIAGCPAPMDMSRGNGFSSDPYPTVTPGPLPAWDLAGTLAYACAYACAPAGAHAALLAWSIYEDPRPLRNDNVAYVVSMPNKWTVVVMWRHAFNKWWNIAGSFHDPRVPIQSFDHPPTAAEIEDVLRGNTWSFAASDAGFKLLAGNTIDASWPSAPPTHFPAR